MLAIMNRLKALGFLLVFLVPAQMPIAAWLVEHTAWPNAMTWYPLFFLFVMLPAMDYLLGHDPANVPADAERGVALNPWFKLMTLMALPVQLALIAWSGHWFVNARLDWFGMAGWLLSQGLVGGILAINTAHELIHKDGRVERLAGALLLTSVGYHGFKVEHLRGHHVHVATPEDASSARFGQSLWHFLPRALLRNTANAWKLESQRLRQGGRSPLSAGNELLWWSTLWLLLACGFFFALGPKGLAFFLLQGLFAAGSLEIINYIEHYGLQRRPLADGRYERTTHLHSWNSDFALSNLMLFQLQRHSDHHAFPKRRYAILRHHEDSPQLPGGYSAMFVLALCPPLWRRVIDPRVIAFRQARIA